MGIDVVSIYLLVRINWVRIIFKLDIFGIFFLDGRGIIEMMRKKFIKVLI